ncbi:MAG TPA: DUF3862 domain-containing protein [Desulfosporosinus sp.]|nr:DUF3862 domain-containing protein [Desulfosporosinus sp.]
MGIKMKNCKACGKEVAPSAKVCPSCGQKLKGGGFIKKMLIGAVVLVMIGVGIGALSDSPSTSSSSNVNKPTMTKAEFDQIKDGMSYAEVTAIVGGPGEMQSESGKVGDPAHTVSYAYKGEGDLGANANVMFQGEKLNMKAQMGLK